MSNPTSTKAAIADLREYAEALAIDVTNLTLPQRITMAERHLKQYGDKLLAAQRQQLVAALPKEKRRSKDLETIESHLVIDGSEKKRYMAIGIIRGYNQALDEVKALLQGQGKP